MKKNKRNIIKSICLQILVLSFLLVPNNLITVYATADQGQDNVTVNLTTYFDAEHAVTTNIDKIGTDPLKYGSKLSLDSNLSSLENYTFAFWIVNDVVRKDLALNYQFRLTKTNVLKAVFKPVNSHAVAFMDSNGKVLAIRYVQNGETVDDSNITLPTKPGYVVSETKWDKPLTNITQDQVMILQYTLSNSSLLTLTVNGGVGVDEGNDGTYSFNEVATVTANTPEPGLYFHHWEADGMTLSYSNPFSFTMLENTSITAYYSSTEPTTAPVVSMSGDLALRAEYKSYLGRFFLPTGYTLVEYGFLSLDSKAVIDLSTPNVNRYPAYKYNGKTNEWVQSIPKAKATTVLAYLITENAQGNLVTTYSQPSYQIRNGGFETGDLSGWNSLSIWKNEPGMLAWTNDRVVNGTYFDQNYSYNRDGNYNLGIYGGTISKDSGQERMGHLRSSDFILGGSGWISFKLGGGKNPAFAFVSVRRTEDNVEVARFGNTNFNNKTLSGTANAEAYMFQYYFNLSSVTSLGTSLYITISDTASNEWSVLSADSFITYYATAPTPGANQTATNIVPEIQGVDTATNTIVNGKFDNHSMSGWTDVSGVFTADGDNIHSNKINGDAATGVLRSSAFTVTTNKYIRLDWAGAIRYDKQLFISVKEVGTNIEVLRFVRRDNLSGKENGDFDNHMLDLSSLNPSKKYYLELCDNLNAGWGLILIDNIRFVPESEWNSVPSGDRAVSISNIATNFSYLRVE